MHSGGGVPLDYLISRACMAVIALLVLSSLSCLMGPTPGYDPQSELDEIAADFCATVDSLARSGNVCDLLWRVPEVSSLSEVTVTVQCGIVRVSSEVSSSYSQPAVTLRVDMWDSPSMNSSAIEFPDESSEAVSCVSGEFMGLSVREVLVGGSSTPLVFVRRAG